MTQINRQQLVKCFEAGKRPNATDFKNLIDSVPNIVDDGTLVRDKNGLRLYPLNSAGTLIRVFRTPEDSMSMAESHELWTLCLNENGTLSLKDDEGNSMLTLDKESGVKIEGNLHVTGTITPQVNSLSLEGGDPVMAMAASLPVHDLPVAPAELPESEGTAVPEARMGQLFSAPAPAAAPYSTSPADGGWHDLPLPENALEEGIHLYRFIAVSPKNEKGDSSMVEATVMICPGESRRIQFLGSRVGRSFNDIHLRWRGNTDSPRLQMSTASDYGSGKVIHYKVTEI